MPSLKRGSLRRTGAVAVKGDLVAGAAATRRSPFFFRNLRGKKRDSILRSDLRTPIVTFQLTPLGKGNTRGKK